MRRRSPRVHGRGRPGLLSACRLDLVVATVSTARPAPPRWRCCNAALPSPPSRRLPRQPRHAGQARPRTAFCSRTSDCGDWHRLVLVVPRPQAPCTDGEDIGRGVSDRPLARRTSSLCKVAWAPCLMWDERASSLGDQIRLPLTHRDAMGATCQHAVERLSADDDMGAFAGTFRGSPGMTSETIAKALAVFECSLPSAPTRFDRWIAGEASALSQSEQNGFAIFTGRCRKRRLASASPSPASTRRSAASIPACAQASRCSDRGACADCWMGRGTFITQLCLAAG